MSHVHLQLSLYNKNNDFDRKQQQQTKQSKGHSVMGGEAAGYQCNKKR